MLSVSSSSSAAMFGWPLEEAVYSYNMHHGFYDHTGVELAAAAHTDRPENFAPDGDRIDGKSGERRKLHHNASERHRRKKINELYSSLRSLLPASEQSRRMSIPTTVSRVLKYIPELQEEVARMEKRKQVMSKKMDKVRESVSSLSSKSTVPGHSGQEVNGREEEAKAQRMTMENSNNRSSVSTSQVADREVVIQISTVRVSVSEILSSLEGDGFQLINASSSESHGGRLFLNLHLQKLDGIRNAECQGLEKKLLFMVENKR
uniref:BHLH domain-containing protein n=1 Tax=Kalanchoe fedtschenkoi TaxID=63787 RepID=A0A7N0T5W2_KALFE